MLVQNACLFILSKRGHPSRNSENTYLRDGSQQLLHTTEAVCLGLQCFSDILGIGHGKFMKEKLLVVISMKQRPNVLGKQIETCELHALLCLVISKNLVQEKTAVLETSRVTGPASWERGSLRVRRDAKLNLKMGHRPGSRGA